MAIGANKVDWEDVAHTLECITPEERFSYDQNVRNYKAAIALCRRMAAGELVERSELEPLQDARAVVQRYSGPCNAEPGEFIRDVCAALKQPTETPAPKTLVSDEDERERCIQGVRDVRDAVDVHVHADGTAEITWDDVLPVVTRLRQTARAEGEARGKIMGERQFAEAWEKYDDSRNTELRELQSQLKRLTDAARAAADMLSETREFIVEGDEPGTDGYVLQFQSRDCETELCAVLAEVEGKNGGGE
jgi:hypothetical protein